MEGLRLRSQCTILHGHDGQSPRDTPGSTIHEQIQVKKVTYQKQQAQLQTEIQQLEAQLNKWCSQPRI